MTIDGPSRAILKVIADNGYTVQASATEVSATDQETGEKYIIRHDHELYAACVQLALKVGIELEDG